VAAVLDALGGVGDDEVVHAVALLYGDGQDELEPGLVHVALGPPPSWNVNEWHGPELELEPWPSDSPEVTDASEVLFEALTPECLNPPRWVLVRVARELMSLPLPIRTAPGFLLLPVDLAAPEHVRPDSEFVAPGVAGSIPDGGPDRGDQIARIRENLDEDELRWEATFSCMVEGYEGAEGEEEHGPRSAALAEALRWGDDRADRIELDVGGTAYTAGRVAIAGLPRWPDGQEVEPRSL
jgi:hypothetical protein